MRRFHLHTCGNFRTSYGEDLTLFKTGFGRLWLIIGLIIVFGLIPLAGNSHAVNVFNIIGIYSIAAIGLNLLTGSTGMVSLGHSAIFGVGAYTASILSTDMNAPFWLTVPAGGIISAVIGTGFCLPAVRLRGFYLCFATLACQKAMEFLFIRWEGLTGGPHGITVSRTGLLGLDLANGLTLYYMVFLLLALTTWMAVNLMRSRFGRAFLAVRDDRETAGIMGVPALRYKLLSFAVSSFYAGIAGSLFAYYNLTVSPGDFSLAFSVVLVAMIIIGGMGSVLGSILGAVVIVLLKEASIYGDSLFSDIFNIPSIATSLYEFVAGLLIVLFILFKPKGLAGVLNHIHAVLSSWPLTRGITNGFKR